MISVCFVTQDKILEVLYECETWCQFHKQEMPIGQFYFQLYYTNVHCVPGSTMCF